MRRAAKIDATQVDIVQAARDIGASWVSLAAVGKGCPDGIIGFRGQNHLVEIKTETGRLRPSQEQFIQAWNGAPVVVLRGVDDLLRLLT